MIDEKLEFIWKQNKKWERWKEYRQGTSLSEFRKREIIPLSH